MAYASIINIPGLSDFLDKKEEDIATMNIVDATRLYNACTTLIVQFPPNTGLEFIRTINNSIGMFQLADMNMETMNEILQRIPGYIPPSEIAYNYDLLLDEFINNQHLFSEDDKDDFWKEEESYQGLTITARHFLGEAHKQLKFICNC